MALFEDDKKKGQQTETQEQLKLLATHLEVLNQRLTGGAGGKTGAGISSGDFERLRQLDDYQHNFIVTTINQKEQSIVKAINANLATMQKSIVDSVALVRAKVTAAQGAGANQSGERAIPPEDFKLMVKAIEDFKKSAVLEIQKNNALNQLHAMQETMIAEINKYRDVNISLDKKVTKLSEILSETLIVLHHQNRLLMGEQQKIEKAALGQNAQASRIWPAKESAKESAKEFAKGLAKESALKVEKSEPGATPVAAKKGDTKEVLKKELEKKKKDLLKRIQEARRAK